ncbi:hypothetical protein GOQ04_23975 [Emticicia sp. ODNR4P]|nr:hypothetical protein [Emticicia sp. ODNR4P]
MKFFALIFSLYILILSCLPCGDAKDCKVLDNGKETFSQTDHHNHQEDTESCSPFCICACCGSNIVFSFQHPVLMTENTPSFFPQRERIIVENDSFASNFYGNIWQPPKI